MDIRELIELSEKEQRFFYEKAPVFLFPEWLNLYNKENILLLGIYDKGNSLIGGFCLYRWKKLGKTKISVPQYAAHNGLFYVNPAENYAKRNSFTKKVLKAISNYLSSEKSIYTYFRLPSTINDAQPFLWDDFDVSLKYTYQIDLQNEQETLLSNFSNERRKNVVKAQKDGVEAKISSDQIVIENLIFKTIDRTDASLDKKITKKIINQFLKTKHCFAFVAYKNNQPAATVLIVHDNNTGYYIMGGYDEANKHEGAGALCMWNAILHCKEMGVKTFDFEGSMLKDVEKYFRGFGGELKNLIGVEQRLLSRFRL